MNKKKKRKRTKELINKIRKNIIKLVNGLLWY